MCTRQSKFYRIGIATFKCLNVCFILLEVICHQAFVLTRKGQAAVSACLVTPGDTVRVTHPQAGKPVQPKKPADPAKPNDASKTGADQTGSPKKSSQQGESKKASANATEASHRAGEAGPTTTSAGAHLRAMCLLIPVLADFAASGQL